MMNENMDMELEYVEISDQELDLITGGKNVIIKGNDVNIRSGPGKEYRSIAMMMDGDKVAYLNEKHKDKEGRKWLKVKCNGMVGWIRADLVKEAIFNAL